MKKKTNRFDSTLRYHSFDSLNIFISDINVIVCSTCLRDRNRQYDDTHNKVIASITSEEGVDYKKSILTKEIIIKKNSTKKTDIIIITLLY